MLGYLYPLIAAFLTVRQRRLCLWGYVALAAESLLLVTATPMIGKSAALALVAIHAIVFMLDYAIYERLGWALDNTALSFGLREIPQTMALMRAGFKASHVVLMASVPLAAMALTWLAHPVVLPGLPWATLAALGALVASGMRGELLPPTSNFVTALCGVIRRSFKPKGLKSATRVILPLEPATEPRRLNTLVFVCESLSRHHLHGEAGKAAAPRYHAFLEKESARTVCFSSAICNSSASDVSYPSLFTGLSPTKAEEQFHRNPLLWAHAKAKGYWTAFYSSQSLRWRNLDQFLIDDSLDRAVFRESLQAPAYNELAMDDRELNRIAADELVQTSRPFFAVVNYNMLHFPYYTGESKSAGNSMELEAAYFRALRRFDECFGALIDALEIGGKLTDTAIFFTADHGESPSSTDLGSENVMPLRVNAFNAEVLRVPFWIRLPDQAVSDKKAAQLRGNANVVVSNIDIYPTVMELLGYDHSRRKEWCSGQSLFSSFKSPRNVIALNTGSLRGWKFEPFALAREGSMLIYDDVSRSLKLFRFDDPDGHDAWPELPASEQARWMAEVEKHAALQRILQRSGLLSTNAAKPSILDEYNSRAKLGLDADLHQLNNWVLFSSEDWNEMCARTCYFVGIAERDRIFEAGCGAGAFLHYLKEHWHAEVAGIDIADKLVDIARQRVPGSYHVGDIQDLSFIASESYDKAVSQGVFLYLPDQEAVRRAAAEMVRITKPGGIVYIGLLNDPERFQKYQSEHPPSGSVSADRDFWRQFAKERSLGLELADQDSIFSKPEGYDAHSRLRYSVLLRK